MPARPGERRLQILQTVASMLENPRGEKITTAALAARLGVSEAALYRHFASKAQMYEGLIEFIESTVFGLINKITGETADGFAQATQIVAMLLSFAEKNPGMTRVLTGDALVNEDDRLQARINQLVDRIEASLRQCLRIALARPEGEAAGGEAPGAAAGVPAGPATPAPSAAAAATESAVRANLLVCYVLGRWQLYAKTGFRRLPSEQWAEQRPYLLGA